MKTLLAIAVLSTTLIACSSNPTLADKAAIQGKQFETVAKRWEKGQDLIKDGNKDIKAGEKLVKKGNVKIKSGKSDVARGTSMVEDSERRYNELNK